VKRKFQRYRERERNGKNSDTEPVSSRESDVSRNTRERSISRSAQCHDCVTREASLIVIVRTRLSRIKILRAPCMLDTYHDVYGRARGDMRVYYPREGRDFLRYSTFVFLRPATVSCMTVLSVHVFASCRIVGGILENQLHVRWIIQFARGTHETRRAGKELDGDMRG
jgi:hypothetical protein